jgi:hypothetical protein
VRDLQGELQALAKVGAWAMFLRHVAVNDWGPKEPQVWGEVLKQLFAALDNLEMVAPAIHAQLSQEFSVMIADARRDLGL